MIARISAWLRCAAWLLLVGAVAAPAYAAPRTDLVLGMAIEPSGLDPTIAAPVAIGQVTWQNVFQGLVRIASDGKIVPQLATGWSITPDGLTYRFALRSGVRFQNGEPFNSTVAKFSLDRARGDQSTNPQKQFYTVIDSIDTPDASTLVLHLKKPAGNLVYWLGWPSSVMVAPRSAEGNKVYPIGTGPFRFKNWVKGDRVLLEKNPYYWDKAHPATLDRVTFRFIGDPQAQAAALLSGDVDAFPEFGSPELFVPFKTNAKFSTVVGDTELKVVAGLNNARKPFDDRRVRQALMMAVDRPILIDAVGSGFGKPVGSHYAPSDPGYVDLTGVLPYDPAKAKALLAEAGYPNGFALTIKTPQMAYASRSAEVLEAMLVDIGVTVTIEPTEFPAKWIQDVFKNHDFEMTIIAHAEPLDIAIYSRPDYYFGYRNPIFDALINKAEQTTDDATRLGLYGEAQRILATDVPALYLYVMPKLGIWNATLKGLWADEPIPSNDLTGVSWEN